MKNQKKLFALCLALSWGPMACTTTEEAKPVNPKAYYTLKLGTSVDHGNPLPKETRILINWHASDGKVKTVEGFRGWDFDHDGRFEMIEVLNEQGKPQSYVFDFDGDGAIDKISGQNEGDIDPKTIFAKAQKLMADPAYAH